MSIGRIAQPLRVNPVETQKKPPVVKRNKPQPKNESNDEYKPSNAMLGFSGGMIGGALTGAAVLGIANASVAIGEITAEKGLGAGAKLLYGAVSGSTGLVLGGMSGVIAGGIGGALLGSVAGTFIGSTIQNDTAAAVIGGITGLAIGAGLLYMSHDKLAGLAGAAIGAGSGALSSYAVSKQNSPEQ